MIKLPLRLVPPTTVNRTVTPTRRPNADYRTREPLTQAEVNRLIKAAGKNRWGHRDATVVLVVWGSVACWVGAAGNPKTSAAARGNTCRPLVAGLHFGPISCPS